jgi:uncharacterized protein YggE
MYAASCPIAVECRPDVAAQAISEAIAAGVDRLSGPRFSVRDRSPVIEELLGEAIEAARRKAERVAEEEIAEPMSASSGHLDLQPAQVTLSASVRVTFSLS